MKKFVFLFVLCSVLFTISMFSTELGLTNSTCEIKRPSYLPKNLPYNWGTFQQTAYEEGRLFYNKDSTICRIEGGRKLTEEHVKRFDRYNEYYDKWYSDSATKAREKNPTWYMREFNKKKALN